MLAATARIWARLSLARLGKLTVAAARGFFRRLLPVGAHRMCVMRGLWRIRAGSRCLGLLSWRHGGAQLRNDPS
jgi:hypothetical protein